MYRSQYRLLGGFSAVRDSERFLCCEVDRLVMLIDDDRMSAHDDLHNTQYKFTAPQISLF